MAVADVVTKVKDAITPGNESPTTIPSDVEAKLKRGRLRLKQLAPSRRECIEFTNGNQYVYINADGATLGRQGLVPISQGGTKPDHRVRIAHNQILPIIKAKVASATSQIPSYECNPSTADQEDMSAAKLAGKVASAGYDLWDIKRAMKKLVWNAMVTDEGFIRAYWDGTVGPYVDVSQYPEGPEGMPDPGSPEYVGMGEIKVQGYSGLEVMWEPGVDLPDSRWIAIEHGRPVEEVEQEPGFMGGSLKADAEATGNSTSKVQAGAKLVLVTEYLERPCPQWPNGRRLFFANKRLIFPEEPYPLQNGEGEVVDEPCIHRLAYDVDPSSDHDRGLVRNLIGPQRQYNNAANKIAEWMQQALIPQLLAEEGSLVTPPTDEPGSVVEYRPTMPGQKAPEWRTVPQIPPQLFQICEEAMSEMSTMSHSFEIPAGIRGASAIQAIYEKDELAWQDFTTDLADVHSRLMRDCLVLVQRHYTEERLVKFRGRTGWENIADFKGADIRNQTDIRVLPGSLEPKTRTSIEQRIMNIAQMFPGYFPPEVLLSALEGGSAEGLIEGYEEDVARANLVIGQIRAGTFWKQPPRPVFPGEEAPKLDEQGQPEWITPPTPGTPPEVGPEGPIPGTEVPPTPGQPVMETELPGWMPRPFDNVAVHKAVFTSWMKTDDWEKLDEESKQASMAYYSALLDIESKKAQRDAAMQTEQAEQAGMMNAAKPPGANVKPMPSLPAAPSGVTTGAPGE